MLAMLIGGLWHGAGWAFVIWGGLHGAYLIVNHGWRRLIPASRTPGIASVWAGRVVTFAAVVAAWVFFRADNTEDAFRLLAGMSGFGENRSELASAQVILWLVAMLFVVWFTPNTCQMFRAARPVLLPPGHREDDTLQNRTAIRISSLVPLKSFALTLLLGVLALVSVLIVIDQGGQTQRFIYMIF
jgi:hypothetical protein